MGKFWSYYVRASLPTQAFLALLSCLLVTASFSLALMGLQGGVGARAFLGSLAALVLDDPDSVVPGTTRVIYNAVLIVIVAVWQAVFLMRILTRSHGFRFSKRAALYPQNPMEANSTEPIVVFRLMNDGEADLFDVSIQATLRVYLPQRDVYQHFQCTVINSTIPVFRRGMPFWIAIETGEVHVRGGGATRALDVCYLFSRPVDADVHRRLVDQTYAQSVTEECRLDGSAFCLIVFVKGHDIEMNQAKAATAHYPLLEIAPGYFKSIEARKDADRINQTSKFKYFTRKAVSSSFDVIEPVSPPSSLFRSGVHVVSGSDRPTRPS